VDEIEHDLVSFGIRDFLFWTESFTLSPENSLETANEIIRRQLKVRWVCNSRVDQVDLQMLKTFKQAGCWMIGYGLESGCQHILDLMNKKTSLHQAEQSFLWAKAAGLQITAHVILGYPGENEKDIQTTVKFVKKLDPDFAQFYTAVPFPGSALYTECLDRSLLVSSDWTRFEQNYSVIKTRDLSPERIELLRRKAFREFYLRPSKVWKTAKRFRSLVEWKQAVRALKGFVDWI
jgi:radical SAM superfamily enzyme YgiQ (UPF0313 family)